MAAAGGGKIRSRRHHITSKPYAKSRQQQSGLISRVTDTVKSIVPSWLQKYFKNGDVEEGGGAREGMEQNCQQPLPPNGSEEAPPSLDGRDSPEPSTSHTEPPGRASLNFQEYVLSRPPLSRSHLHFPPLDVSSPPPPRTAPAASLLSQPSTSSAPGPFSTGFSLVKEIKDNLSQHEDDNISTTSGFSSRASDKDVPTSKTASLPQLWSPETDRTGSGPQPSQSALKKPAFNLSVFGTSSNATLNSSLLGCSQLGDSPFYPGKTTYGGAAAARGARARPGTPYQAPVRRQIKAKPAGTQPCGVTSATARRILQSLERMSSPVADAKRIPAMASPVSAVMDSSALRASHLQPKKKRLESSLPPVQKLLVPASPSVSRSVTFRPTLTPGGGIRPLDQTPRATSSRQSPQRAEATPLPSLSTSGSSGPSGAAYPLSSTPAPSGPGGGKMKRERSSARPNSRRPDDDEVPEVPDLPPISLPLSTAALPTFSFSSPLPPVRSSPVVATAPPAKESPSDEDSSSSSAAFVAERTAPSTACVPFTFSSPIVKATPESPPTFSSSAGFTFSAPVAKLGPPMSNGKLAKPTAVKPAETKSTEEEFEGPFKPAKVLKQGSVLDLLRAPGFSSPAAGASASVEVPSQPPLSLKAPPGWSCDVCLVQNKSSDARCVCCAAPKPDDSSSTAGSGAGLAAVFSRPTGTWDCDTCLVVNKPESVKCVACETAKPGTGLKPSLTLQAQASPISLQKPPGAWECDTCLVQNKADQSACVACTSLKPGSGAAGPGPGPGFGHERSRAAEGGWDCDVCLLQNKAADSACVACQAARPGASAEPKGSSSSSSSSSASGGFKFGVSSSDSSSSSSSSSSAGFKLGVQFGSLSQGSSKDSAGFKFGGSAGGFKFGLSSSETEQSKPPPVAAAAAAPGFTFGTGVFGSGPSGSESASSKGAFTFGLSKPEEKAPDASSSLSPAASRQEKSNRTSADAAGGSVFGRLGETPTPPGAPAAEAEPAAPTFTFGKPEKKEAPPAFLFGSVAKDTEATAPPASGAFSFSKPAASGEQTPPTFSFGKSADKSGAASSDAPKTAFTFGQSGADSAAPKQAFSFMASNPSGSAPSTSSTSGPPSVFGSSTLSAAPSTTTTSSSVLPSVFGGSAPITSSSSSVLPSVFGGSAPSPAQSTSSASITPSVFGGSAPSSAPSTTSSSSVLPSVFGGSAPSSTPSTSSASITPSVFGGSAPSLAPSTTSSSSVLPSVFGGSAPGPAAASSAAPSSFLFGAASASSGEAPPAKTFIFGSSEQQQQQQPAPAAPLGSAAAPPPAAFIFGAPPPAAAGGSAASSFSFGSAAPPSASSAAPPAAPPAFAFNSAPSGGFGASPAPSFGASFGAVFPGSAPGPAPASQTPAFGAKPAAAAAPVFGQQSNATSVFGGGAGTGGGFQFGGTSSGPGVFTFGAGAAQAPAPTPAPAAAPQAPTGGGFNFTQSPAFNMGSTKAFAASPAGQASIPGRKIKTAVRRRK